jgi:gas vesicle protein
MSADESEVLDTVEDEEDEGLGHEGHGAGTFLAGLAIGALVGAGVALLFAPQSGQETRQRVARRARRLVRDARDRYDDVKDKARRARRERGRAEEDEEATAD